MDKEKYEFYKWIAEMLLIFVIMIGFLVLVAIFGTGLMGWF